MFVEGIAWGIHWSLASSALALLIVATALIGLHKIESGHIVTVRLLRDVLKLQNRVDVEFLVVGEFDGKAHIHSFQ